jgi:hypothetical protein
LYFKDADSELKCTFGSFNKLEIRRLNKKSPTHCTCFQIFRYGSQHCFGFTGLFLFDRDVSAMAVLRGFGRGPWRLAFSTLPMVI